MKRFSLMPFVILIICTSILIVALSTPNASAKTIGIRFANYFPPNSDMGQLYKDFCAEIEKRSNKQVKMSYFPGGSLVNSKDSPDAVSKGIVDIAYCSPIHNAGRFPVTEAFTNMIGFPTAYVASHVADDFIKHIAPKAKELDDYQVLLAGAFSPMIIFSTTPVKTIDDFKGLKIRARGPHADTVRAWGSTPVSMPISDCYDSFKKGIIDGIAVSLEAGESWRLGEATQFCTLTWQIFTPPIYFVMMNKKVYDGLPGDIKKVFDEVSAEWVEKEALVCNNTDVSSAKFCKDKGMKFIKLSPEDARKGQADTRVLYDKHIKMLIDKGVSDAKNYEDFFNARTDYWVQQQIKNRVKSPMGPDEVLLPGLF